MAKLPKVYFGVVSDDHVDWRAAKLPPQKDDDELLAITPPDVIGMLGFDPLDLFNKCPLCGEPLVDSDSGIWCCNPCCDVVDDYLMYKEGDHE
jgi:hypothetical protein